MVYKGRVLSPDCTLDLPGICKNMSSRNNDKIPHCPTLRLIKSPGDSNVQAGLRLIYADMILIHLKIQLNQLSDVTQILKTG